MHRRVDSCFWASDMSFLARLTVGILAETLTESCMPVTDQRDPQALHSFTVAMV